MLRNEIQKSENNNLKFCFYIIDSNLGRTYEDDQYYRYQNHHSSNNAHLRPGSSSTIPRANSARQTPKLEKEKIKRNFLFFLKKTPTTAQIRTEKNLPSTSSLQHLQSMDNSESIEVCDFGGSSPDLVQKKHEKIYRDSQESTGNDDEEEFYLFLNKKTVTNRRDQEARYQSGCCRLFSCIFVLHSQLTQFLARKKIEHGLKLYEKNNFSAAMRVWKNLIKSKTVNNRIDLNGEDLFLLLGYLYQACINFGKYFDAMEYAKLQLNLSDEFNLTKWRAESYLNLSLVCEKLGKLEKALSYARHSLYNECDRKSCFTIGMVYMTVAKVYLEMGGFSRSLEDLQNSHRISLQINDISLELKCYLTLSELFDRLNDIDKSIKYASKSYDLSRSLQLNNLNTLDHRQSLLRMASALRKNAEFGDAQDYCNEAIRLSLMAGDQSSYIRSMRIMGDIYRKSRKSSNYLTVAFQQYEQSMGLASIIGDRMGQMEAMDGAARCLEILRLEKKICNCRPLEFNTRLLEVANTIGSKLLVRKIRARLSLIYQALGDEEQHKLHKRLANQTEIALGLICGVCNEKIGLESNTLEVLPCSHILHDHCANEIYQQQSHASSSSQVWKRSTLEFLQQKNQQEVYNCPACKAKFNVKKTPKKKTKKRQSSSQRLSSPPPPPLPPHHARHCNSLKENGAFGHNHSFPRARFQDGDDEDELQIETDPGEAVTDDNDDPETDANHDDDDSDEMLLLGLNELKKNFFFDKQPKFRNNLDDFEDELDVKLRELDNEHLHSYHHQRSNHNPVLRNFCGQEQAYENGEGLIEI